MEIPKFSPLLLAKIAAGIIAILAILGGIFAFQNFKQQEDQFFNSPDPSPAN